MNADGSVQSFKYINPIRSVYKPNRFYSLITIGLVCVRKPKLLVRPGFGRRRKNRTDVRPITGCPRLESSNIVQLLLHTRGAKHRVV